MMRASSSWLPVTCTEQYTPCKGRADNVLAVHSDMRSCAVWKKLPCIISRPPAHQVGLQVHLPIGAPGKRALGQQQHGLNHGAAALVGANRDEPLQAGRQQWNRVANMRESANSRNPTTACSIFTDLGRDGHRLRGDLRNPSGCRSRWPDGAAVRGGALQPNATAALNARLASSGYAATVWQPEERVASGEACGLHQA